MKETALFLSEGDDENELSFGLVTTDLTQIKPNYEAMIKGGTLRLNDDGYAQSKQNMFDGYSSIQLIVHILFFDLTFTPYI